MIHAPAAEFRFVESPHSYWLGPERVPNVTGVIKDHGFIKSDWYTEEGRARGKAVHRGLALDNLGRLAWTEAAEKMAGYLESNRKLAKSMKWRVLEVEVARFHPLWRYAGTLDLRLLLGRDQEVVADYKTGDMPSWTRWQVWALDLMIPERRPRKHWGIQVYPDGRMANVTEFDDDRYAGEKFLSFLTTTRERMAAGVSQIFADAQPTEGATHP